MKHITIAFLAFVLLATPWLLQNYPEVFASLDRAYSYVGVNLAAALLHNPVTVAQLKADYVSPTPKQVKILVMPGHEPGFGGTEYKDLKEREMNVELANDLAEFLKSSGHYDVVVPRDNNAWNPVFAQYFKDHWDDIISFFKSSRDEGIQLVQQGKATNVVATVSHNRAPVEVAYRLYGINKWENENNVDIAIHVHFNDYPRSDTSVPGEYSGFAIYVPMSQYANSTTTNTIAKSIFKRLSRYNAVSNLEAENSGVVQEPDLIAIGAHNTANAASMLIEYGYIYEPQFADPTVRKSTIRDLAFQTYLGLQDFFGTGNNYTTAFDTLMLPHSWNSNLTASSASKDDVLALQSALLLDGDYPGDGKTKNDCPRTGKIGPCTLDAISTFQKKYQITGESGMVGDKTQKLLNERFSVHL